jgi:uncharacterized membrane protein YhhN
MHKLSLAFGVLLVIHIMGLLANISLAATLTKPVLVPCLAGLVWLQSRTIRGHGVILAALFFSWLGDVLLMRSGEGFFMGGLAAFLSAHVCYIWIFSREATLHPLRVLPFLMYVALLLAGPLHGKLPESLQIPVHSYVVVITAMGIVASLRNTQRPGYELILIGSILFILSDSFLALNKFSSPLPLAGFWVMLTYGLAQYFIVKGYLAGHFPQDQNVSLPPSHQS